MVKLTKNDMAPGSTVAETLGAHERGESRDHTLEQEGNIVAVREPARTLPGPGTAPPSPGTPTAQVRDAIGTPHAFKNCPQGAVPGLPLTGHI